MKDSERICKDIQETRQRITGKAEALKRRISPPQGVQPVAHAKEMLQGGGRKILDTFKSNPVPMALTGIGLGWLIYRDIVGTREGGLAAGPKDELSPGIEQAKEAAGTVGDKISHGAAKVKEAAAQSVRKTGDWFSSTMESNPLILAMGALAVGIIGGLSLPVTQKEKETVGKLGEKAAGAVLEKGTEGIEKTVPEAQKVEQQAPMERQSEAEA